MEDEHLEDERLGFTVKVAGIKQKPARQDSFLENNSIEEEDIIGEDGSNARSQGRQVNPGAEKDFYMWDEPLSSMQVTVSSFENNPNVKNHIIVCGIHSSIINFLMPLRAKFLKEFQIQKVVIITGEPEERGGEQIDPAIWKSISRFKYIYLVNGSPLKQETLLKANVNYADKVVILGHD